MEGRKHKRTIWVLKQEHAEIIGQKSGRANRSIGASQWRILQFLRAHPNALVFSEGFTSEYYRPVEPLADFRREEVKRVRETFGFGSEAKQNRPTNEQISLLNTYSASLIALACGYITKIEKSEDPKLQARALRHTQSRFFDQLMHSGTFAGKRLRYDVLHARDQFLAEQVMRCASENADSPIDVIILIGALHKPERYLPASDYDVRTIDTRDWRIQKYIASLLLKLMTALIEWKTRRRYHRIVDTFEKLAEIDGLDAVQKLVNEAGFKSLSDLRQSLPITPYERRHYPLTASSEQTKI